MRRALIALLSMLLPILVLSACGQKSPAARCPDAVTMPCATPLECDYDKTRMCNVCRCSAPSFIGPAQQQKMP